MSGRQKVDFLGLRNTLSTDDGTLIRIEADPFGSEIRLHVQPKAGDKHAMLRRIEAQALIDLLAAAVAFSAANEADAKESNE